MAKNKDRLTYQNSNRIRVIYKMTMSVLFGTALSFFLALSGYLFSPGLSGKFAFILFGIGLLFLLVLGVCYWLTITRRVSRSRMWAFLKFLEGWPLGIFWFLEVLVGMGVFHALVRGGSTFV